MRALWDSSRDYSPAKLGSKWSVAIAVCGDVRGHHGDYQTKAEALAECARLAGQSLDIRENAATGPRSDA